jgi:hypothetical protein
MAHSIQAGPVMAPRVIAEGGARAIGELCVVLQDPTIWLSVLCAGLLIVIIVGVLLATRHQRRRGQRGTGGSVTDWGQSLALTYELRRETKRLSEENQRLWEERAELLKAFGRVVACLQQEVDQISGKSLGPKSDTTKSRRDSGITNGSDVWEANGSQSGSVRRE